MQNKQDELPVVGRIHCQWIEVGQIVGMTEDHHRPWSQGLQEGDKKLVLNMVRLKTWIYK